MCHDSCKQWEGDEGCSNLVLAQSCVFLLALHPNSLFLLPIVLEGENLGVLASIFILKKKKKGKRSHEEVENYKTAFIQAGKNEVNKGRGW